MSLALAKQFVVVISDGPGAQTCKIVNDGTLQEQDDQTISVITECTTAPTGSDGIRHSCKAECWSVVEAPEGYVINNNPKTEANPRGYTMEKISRAGTKDGSGYWLEWHDEKEVFLG
ncbi:hypothetical protein BGZ72_001371 [Mortierella alpina]|nr:hypothetical protein BGZ72_001371 [Mortierella alpina]